MKLKLAIVDYDGTLFTKESIPFLMSLAKKKDIPKKDYYLALLKVYIVVIKYKSGIFKSFGKEKFHIEVAKAFLSIFNNMDKDEIEKFFIYAAKEAENFFNPLLIEKLKVLKSEGYHMVLLSGGFLPYVKLVGEKLNFDKIFATELEYGKKGFNLKNNLKFITGKNKKEKILSNFPEECNINWAASYSFADSYFDSDVLEITGHPHAVNPDSKLKELAIEKGWPIINLY